MLSLNQAFKALKPFKQSSQPLQVLKALQTASFSTSPVSYAEQPQPIRPQVGASSLFENVQVESEAQVEEKQVAEKQYNWSSANFKTSPRKLNMIARQLRNLPVDEAIRQLEYSPKRSAKKILHNLAFAKKNAQEQKNMKNLVVAQAWVGKGRYIRRVNPHGRGQFGLMHHKEAHMKFILKEADSLVKDQEKTGRRNIRGWKDTKKVWTPLVENKPIYNPKPFYNW
ncbi:ribosomal protein L22/L17 [Halteromyces radiatus]|uniref:ribosomal protein L22/L17 n=1 Tax=Halteromyces radiatus TaxID=101107 RepID=UPI00222090E7|nr:ribosomal protein L22/L17 [Halteromyces radiatus]KAI8086299.1 ribosomal protein L22/L17 [Halteromyces radiatus]